MDVMLNGLKTQFDIIGLSETWLKESNCDLYNIKNYAAYHKIRKHKDRVGIALYIKNGIEYTVNALILRLIPASQKQYLLKLISLLFTHKKNILIGLFYKAPDQDIDLFNNVFSDLMKKVNKENIFFILFICSRQEQNNTIQYKKYISYSMTKHRRITIYSIIVDNCAIIIILFVLYQTYTNKTLQKR